MSVLFVTPDTLTPCSTLDGFLSIKVNHTGEKMRRSADWAAIAAKT
ncbi:MAG: hypothetical protein K2P80_14625 [Beijerinckiaceae bacterium]|nr:hypothetical protein [Beijerinckiaceae bacterium]